MAKIDSAYAYYASTYANKEVSRYDSHKKKRPAQDIQQNNKRQIKSTPLYKISKYIRSQEICYRYKGKL